MPVLQVYQQSLAGTILRIILLPFTFLLIVLKFILKLIWNILLLPYYLIKYLLIGIKKLFIFLMPEFYEANVIQSFKGLFCAFKIFLIVLTGLLIILLPLHFLPLVGARIAKDFFDLMHALTLMGKTFLVTEVAFIGIAVVGFLLSFFLAFLFISVYSPLQFLGEILEGITAQRLLLMMMFGVALVVFGVLYLILTGEIPI